MTLSIGGSSSLSGSAWPMDGSGTALPAADHGTVGTAHPLVEKTSQMSVASAARNASVKKATVPVPESALGKSETAAPSPNKNEIRTTERTRLDEEGKIRQLKAQGQNLPQIAVDLNISVAAVNGDLETDIPKVSARASGEQAPNVGSSFSVFA